MGRRIDVEQPAGGLCAAWKGARSLGQLVGDTWTSSGFGAMLAVPCTTPLASSYVCCKTYQAGINEGMTTEATAEWANWKLPCSMSGASASGLLDRDEEDDAIPVVAR